MSETKFTPGPWILQRRDREFRIVSNCSWEWDIATVDNDVNCVRSNSDTEGISLESIANAKLIAASPDLLEALQEAQKALKENYPWPELHAKIQTAIDKATK